MNVGFDRPRGFGGEDLWKWSTDGRRRSMDSVSSPCETDGSGEMTQLARTLSSKWQKLLKKQ